VLRGGARGPCRRATANETDLEYIQERGRIAGARPENASASPSRSLARDTSVTCSGEQVRRPSRRSAGRHRRVA
jgi:hypothetical protein